jgi:putative MATE family efflux protein
VSARDLTTGAIAPLLGSLTVPILVATTLQSVYALAGLAWVGRLGEPAVGGLSIGLQAFFVVLAIGQSLGTTAMADLSQDMGAGRRDHAARAFSGYLVLALALGVLASIAAFAVAVPYVSAFTADPEVLAEGVSYFRWSAPSFGTQLVLLVLVTGLRATGDFTTPVRVTATTVVLNVVLDPILMFGLGMGIGGAGLATVICQAIACSWLLWALLRGDGFRLGRPRLDAEMFRAVATRGLPAGLQFLLLFVSMGLILSAMKPFGPAWTAAAGGGFRLVQQAILPIVAIGTAAAAMVGQNAGAGRPERVRRTVWTALGGALAWSVAAIAVVQAGAPWIARVFASPDELGPATTYLRVASPALVGFAGSLPATFSLQALKRPVLPLVAAAVRLALLAAVCLAASPTGAIGAVAVFATFALGAAVEAAIDVGMVVFALRTIPPAAGTPATPTPDAPPR